VVAGGQDIDLEEDLFADVLGDTAPAGGVLAVGDDHGRGMLFDQARQEFVHGPPARPADDIAEEENAELIAHIRPPSSPG
jgi:hypothetical protein